MTFARVATQHLPQTQPNNQILSFSFLLSGTPPPHTHQHNTTQTFQTQSPPPRGKPTREREREREEHTVTLGRRFITIALSLSPSSSSPIPTCPFSPFPFLSLAASSLWLFLLFREFKGKVKKYIYELATYRGEGGLNRAGTVENQKPLPPPPPLPSPPPRKKNANCPEKNGMTTQLKEKSIFQENTKKKEKRELSRGWRCQRGGLLPAPRTSREASTPSPTSFHLPPHPLLSGEGGGVRGRWGLLGFGGGGFGCVLLFLIP